MSEFDELIFDESSLTEPHTITFADGTEITVTINGNNYISAEPVPDNLLRDANLIGLKIDGETQPANMTCCNHFADAEGDHIIFRQYTSDEMKDKKFAADIDYLLMLTE